MCHVLFSAHVLFPNKSYELSTVIGHFKHGENEAQKSEACSEQRRQPSPRACPLFVFFFWFVYKCLLKQKAVCSSLPGASI